MNAKRIYIITIVLSLIVMVSFSQEKKKTPVYGSFTDTRDGNTYLTVKIGKQIWMAENLRYKTEKGCWAYDNDTSKVYLYGYLYNYKTAKNVCPQGWHLPTYKEFETLYKKLGNNDSIVFNQIHGGASGFKAIISGYRYPDGKFDGIGSESESGYWSQTEYDRDDAFFLRIVEKLLYGYLPQGGRAYIANTDDEFGLAVRCIKD